MVLRAILEMHERTTIKMVAKSHSQPESRHRLRRASIAEGHSRPHNGKFEKHACGIATPLGYIAQINTENNDRSAPKVPVFSYLDGLRVCLFSRNRHAILQDHLLTFTAAVSESSVYSGVPVGLKAQKGVQCSEAYHPI